jgi:CheY-like chemotaxis protein
MNEQGQRVLIVDDDPEVRNILATALRQRALSIDEATNGREAIELLRQQIPYSVVLLDLMMPHVDGFSVLDAIHADLPNPPIVLVVTGASREMIERLDTQRIHGVVRKPFDPIEVASIVAAVTDVRGGSSFETMAIAALMSGGALISWL